MATKTTKTTKTTAAALTELETALLHNLKSSGFEGPDYWSHCLTGGLITNRNVAGVVSSLCKKGILKATACQGEDTITLLGELQ